MTRRRRLDQLDDVTAARLASATLGRPVARSTVRWWKHDGRVTGGRGWFDRTSFRDYVLALKAAEESNPHEGRGGPSS